MEPTEYVFSIDVFTPDTLPMARLAQYLAELAQLIGHQDHTHFRRVEPGSARLRTMVEAVDVPKVEDRLQSVRNGAGPKEAMKAKQSIEDLLANDNAIATLADASGDRIVVPFVGRNRPKPITFPPFREDTSIDGVLVNIGGRDITAHAMLQDGEIVHSGISMRRELARELASLLYGPTIRLYGSGRFERQSDGVWKMSDYRVDRWEKLDDRPLSEALGAGRAIPGNRLMDHDAARDVAADRSGEADTE